MRGLKTATKSVYVKLWRGVKNMKLPSQKKNILRLSHDVVFKSFSSEISPIIVSKSKNAFLLTFYALSMNFRKWVCENIFKNRLQHPVAQFSTSKQHSSNVRLNLIIQNAKFENTLPRKNMNLPYSKPMYWTIFWQSNFHA